MPAAPPGPAPPGGCLNSARRESSHQPLSESPPSLSGGGVLLAGMDNKTQTAPEWKPVIRYAENPATAPGPESPEWKAKFIRDLAASVVEGILAKVQHMPAEWDGHELREYLADEFARNRSALMREPRSRRLRDYRNTVNVTGGL